MAALQDLEQKDRLTGLSERLRIETAEKKWPQAEKTASDIIALNPAMAEGYALRALARQQQGDGKIPEALADPSLGVVVASNEPELLAEGVTQTLNRRFDPNKLRRAASLHDLDAVARRHVDLFARVCER